MIRNICIATAIGALALGTAIVAGPTFAQTNPMTGQHDSNTLHKLGNAIQYPVRKAGENSSVALHEGTHSKSVEHNRHNGMNVVVTPKGHEIVKSQVGRYAHHRHHRHHHRHHVTTH